jgi:hypothetical protein
VLALTDNRLVAQLPIAKCQKKIKTRNSRAGVLPGMAGDGFRIIVQHDMRLKYSYLIKEFKNIY